MPSPKELKKIQEENMSEKQIEQSAVREENYNAGHEAGNKEAQASKQELEEMKKTDETESAEKHAKLLKELKGEGNGETAEPKEGNKEKQGEEFEVAKAEYEKIDEIRDNAIDEVKKIEDIAKDKFGSSEVGSFITDTRVSRLEERDSLLKNMLLNPEKDGPKHTERLKSFLERGFMVNDSGLIEKFKLRRGIKELIVSIGSLSEEYKAAVDKVKGLEDEVYEKKTKFIELGGKKHIGKREGKKFWEKHMEEEEPKKASFWYY